MVLSIFSLKLLSTLLVDGKPIEPNDRRRIASQFQQITAGNSKLATSSTLLSNEHAGLLLFLRPWQLFSEALCAYFY